MENFKNIPVYQHTELYAMHHDETIDYFSSHRANIACKKAIEDAIAQHYNNNRLSREGVKQVEEVFGVERLLYVLAVTVRYREWDGRYSEDNKRWAQTIPIVFQPDMAGRDRNLSYVVDQAHPGLVNLFLEQARKQMPVSRPSILEQLRNPRKEDPTISAGGFER